MKILITICARAGSKGVKNKNIRKLNGQPLIYWSIKQALNWSKADQVIVSTDSKEIAEIAKMSGAQVPFMRDEKLATDKSGKLAAIKDAWKKCEKIYKIRYDFIIDLDVTAPLRTTKNIDECLDLVLEKNALNVFSVVPAHRNPYFNMVEKRADGSVMLCKKIDKRVIRRQDAPKVFDMNASIYVYSREFMENDESSIFNNRSYFYIMKEISRYDIDADLDFKVTELLIEKGLWRFK